ncbi:hypothetical protein TrRE_jg1627 [Triparma retinervis]|uniref:Uncharacterized protein n=1 Tax=Triparma retinervis TaxID=2557542 RepID=A0A9W7FX00_9STRA|nr:hypothetical protein TrRE_jg1627 [Triparma retinervis]
MEPRVIKKGKEVLDWNDRDLLLAVLELLSGFGRLAPGGVITKANIEQNDDLVHLNKILSYVCMVTKTKREELFVKPKSSVDNPNAGDTGHIIKHKHYKKLFQSVFKQKSTFKQAKKTLSAVADALERTVPLQEILANAVWLGDEDIIRKYGGTLGDERKEHRWIDKFAFVGLNPLPQAPERAMKIGDLNTRLKLVKEKHEALQALFRGLLYTTGEGRKNVQNSLAKNIFKNTKWSPNAGKKSTPLHAQLTLVNVQKDKLVEKLENKTAEFLYQGA